jgi:hypothetical protein
MNRQISLEKITVIKNKFIMMLNDCLNLFNNLQNNNSDMNDIEFTNRVSELKDKIGKLYSIKKSALDNNNITFTPEDIQNYGYDPIQKLEELINIRIPERQSTLFKLNYNYDITFINLRDIRFSQSNISNPFTNEIENDISRSMDNYPFKFFNYENNDLVLLRMFGENDYTQNDKEETSYNPTVPSLNVVKMKNNNCYISIDNRRLSLIFRQLCLLLSVDPQICRISDMAFKNTNDFLRFNLGIPDSAHIYIPCSVKDFDKVPSRKMKTPEGTQLAYLNREIGYSENSIEPSYAGVIWHRVTNPIMDKYRDYPLNGYQMFPATTSNKNDINKQLNENNLPIYKNLYPCRTASDVIKGEPLNIQTLIDGLVQNNIVKMPYSTGKSVEDYNNLEILYYYIANIFINYLRTGSTEFVESITKDILFNSSYKFLPDFQQWKFNIDKIPLYPEKTGGTRKTLHSNTGGTKRKRCKNGTRKYPKTKRCVKNKTIKNKVKNKPIFSSKRRYKSKKIIAIKDGVVINKN